MRSLVHSLAYSLFGYFSVKCVLCVFGLVSPPRALCFFIIHREPKREANAFVLYRFSVCNDWMYVIEEWENRYECWKTRASSIHWKQSGTTFVCVCAVYMRKPNVSQIWYKWESFSGIYTQHTSNTRITRLLVFPFELLVSCCCCCYYFNSNTRMHVLCPSIVKSRQWMCACVCFAVCFCYFSDSAMAHAVPMCIRFANDMSIFFLQWYFDDWRLEDPHLLYTLTPFTFMHISLCVHHVRNCITIFLFLLSLRLYLIRLNIIFVVVAFVCFFVLFFFCLFSLLYVSISFSFVQL